MDLARHGRSRFDPATRSTFTFPGGLNGSFDEPTVLRIGGLAPGSDRPQLGSDTTAAVHHRAGLYATGTTAAPAPAAAQGPEVWEPAPGWGLGRAVLRRPRALLVIPSMRYAGGIMLAEDCRARIPALAAALGPLGVTVALSSNPRDNIRPLAAAVPTLAMASHREPFASPIDVPIVKLDPTYPPPDALAGGDVMVVELNACRTLFGGIPGIGHPEFDAGYTFLFIDAFQQTTPHPSFPGGTKYEFQNNPFYANSPVDGHPISLWEAFGKPYIFSFPPDAAKDLAAASALAARCRSYRHAVYQLDRWLPAESAAPLEPSGPMDDAGLWAELYGGADFTRRQVVPPDAGSVWDRIAADALSFFGP